MRILGGELADRKLKTKHHIKITQFIKSSIFSVFEFGRSVCSVSAGWLQKHRDPPPMRVFSSLTGESFNQLHSLKKVLHHSLQGEIKCLFVCGQSFNQERHKDSSPWRNCGSVRIVGRDSVTHHNWKVIGVVTLGRGRSSASFVGMDSTIHTTF
ncbi:uncharacterized protein LOC119961677 isoform X2 [Scyliorhinus canicula]|uniref:uncharacterized protein LOC119961677 isoform X2 n=1 Tax=Scyliorhinus canicula TaxID=7830 RepID=UPI0018F3AFF8|nr:uncharacterized protein LOC119961677 isoform X2 [Scyliorhinus canicula]